MVDGVNDIRLYNAHLDGDNDVRLYIFGGIGHHIYRTIVEIMGTVDSYTRTKHIYRIFIEKLGEIPLVQMIINLIKGKQYYDNPSRKIEIYEE
jgi:hypothetical protein